MAFLIKRKIMKRKLKVKYGKLFKVFTVMKKKEMLIQIIHNHSLLI